eukprot:TRINITY_DN93747_c0_g1_i1.p1 TRINITY_DN93747_c0_g1~~TRINITY_DN93747_c0_g1_i1.p1  ORF type:complete len:289 (+),score=51.87 TRINITY_DN93747_c0_g1_i1:92-958(+)
MALHSASPSSVAAPQAFRAVTWGEYYSEGVAAVAAVQSPSTSPLVASLGKAQTWAQLTAAAALCEVVLFEGRTARQLQAWCLRRAKDKAKDDSNEISESVATPPRTTPSTPNEEEEEEAEASSSSSLLPWKSLWRSVAVGGASVILAALHHRRRQRRWAERMAAWSFSHVEHRGPPVALCQEGHPVSGTCSGCTAVSTLIVPDTVKLIDIDIEQGSVNNSGAATPIPLNCRLHCLADDDETDAHDMVPPSPRDVEERPAGDTTPVFRPSTPIASRPTTPRHGEVYIGD